MFGNYAKIERTPERATLTDLIVKPDALHSALVGDNSQWKHLIPVLPDFKLKFVFSKQFRFLCQRNFIFI